MNDTTVPTTVPGTRLFGRTLCLVAAGILSKGLLVGCTQPEPPPEKVLEQFMTNLLFDSEAAWSLLSAASQAGIEERNRRIAEAAGTPAPESPGGKLGSFGIAVTSPPDRVTLVEQSGDSATLDVTVKGGRPARVQMVREGGHWKVDLLASLLPVSTSSGSTTSTAAGPP